MRVLRLLRVLAPPLDGTIFLLGVLLDLLAVEDGPGAGATLLDVNSPFRFFRNLLILHGQ